MYLINFIPKYVNTYIISIDIIKLLHDILTILNLPSLYLIHNLHYITIETTFIV